MAINNVITDDWSGHSHGEVEEALKDKLSEMSQDIEEAAQAGYAPPAGGIPYNDLAKAVRDILDSVEDKVDKVNGKGLSTEDFTSAFKAKLEGLGNYDDTQILAAVNMLRSALDGLATVATSGSYNDLTDKPNIPAVSEADAALSDTSENAVQNKVVKAAIDSLRNALDTLIGSGNVQGAIDTFNEVKTFLAGISTNDQTLFNQLLALNNAITNLQTALAGKISGIKANGASTTLPVDPNGVVELPPAGTTISPATATPSMDGTAAVGSSEKYAREDHVHPHDTSKQDKLTSSTTLMTINGNTVHYGESVTVQGEKGEQGETGHVQVDGNGNVLIYNGLDKTTTGAALDASQGQFIGKLLNANDNTFYNVWVGTAAELEALDGDYDDNTIYLVGTVATVAQRFNVTFDGGGHTSIPANTPETVKEGSSFSVVVSPASGYTIDSCSAIMGNSTIQGVALTGADAGKYSITINSVTAAITITADATKHITGITVSTGTRSGNSIPLTAAVNPSDADNVTLTWSVDDTTNFSISGSGASATLTVKSGASNASVTITCADTNASSGTASGMLQLTGITYDDAVLITALGTVSYAAGQNVNTYQFSVEKTPANGNTPAIVWSVESTPNGAATMDPSTGLLTVTENCSVVVTATATGVTSVDTGSTPIEFSYALSGPIQFKDLNAKRFLLFLTAPSTTAANAWTNASDADVEADTSITYENASLKGLGMASSNYDSIMDPYKKDGIHAVKYFPERHLFTTLATKINTKFRTELTAIREMSVIEETDNTYGVTNLPYLTRLHAKGGFTVVAGTNGSIGSCASLQIVDLRETSITSINGQRLFRYCTQLKTVRLPESLVTIADNTSAMQFCRDGRTNAEYFVEFNGTQVQTIKINPYSTNDKLNLIFTSETAIELDISNVIIGSSGTSKLNFVYVPDTLVETYKTQWSDISSKIKGISELPADWDKTIFNISMTGVSDTSATPITSVEGWTSFNTTIQADEGNSLADVVVTMCGEDITADVLDTTTGALNIPSVEGNVTINIVTSTE